MIFPDWSFGISESPMMIGVVHGVHPSVLLRTGGTVRQSALRESARAFWRTPIAMAVDSSLGRVETRVITH